MLNAYFSHATVTGYTVCYRGRVIHFSKVEEDYMLRKTRLSQILTGGALAAGMAALATAAEAGSISLAGQDITLGGGTTGGYFYATDTGSKKQDTIVVSDFITELSSEAKPGGVGFTAGLGVLTEPSVYNDELGGTGSYMFQYGWLSLKPVDNLEIDAGQLATNVGYEVAPTYANSNINLGLVWYGQPIYYPGIRATYSMGDMSVYAEVNKNTSYGAKTGAAIGASGKIGGVDALFSYFTNAGKVSIADFILSKTVGGVDLAVNADYQMKAEAVKTAGTDDAAYGIAFYATVPVMDKVTLPLRVEYVDDGTSGLYGLGGAGASNSAISFTVTPTYHFTDNTFVRAELAYVSTDKKGVFFDDKGNPTDSNTSVAVQTGYLF